MVTSDTCGSETVYFRPKDKSYFRLRPRLMELRNIMMPAVGEPSPQLPTSSNHNRRNSGNNNNVNSNSRSRNNNNNKLQQQQQQQAEQETKINVRNLFAAATVGAPRPVTPVGPRPGPSGGGGSNGKMRTNLVGDSSPARRQNMQVNGRRKHHVPCSTVRSTTNETIIGKKLECCKKITVFGFASHESTFSASR